MWLFTTIGFFSVVQKPGEDFLTVRARVREDLDGLREKYLPELSPTKSGAGTDYRFRGQIPHAAFATGLARLAEDIDYPNFKSKIAKSLGPERATVYGKVWSALLELESTAPRSAPANATAPAPTQGKSGRKLAYGGVVIDAEGRVLLREPANHFDGYVWTFPKGKPDAGRHETAEQVALREVLEETGYEVRIGARVPGEFASGLSDTVFFLMEPVRRVGPADTEETAQVRWATFSEAEALLARTTNAMGRERDLKVLAAAVTAWKNRGR